VIVTAHGDGSATPLRVLFVCTANVARSPYAERRARQLLDGRPVAVASAGIPGFPGRPMDPEMAKQLRSRGADPEDHVSRSLTGQLMAEADLVLTFEFSQRMRVFEAWPDQVAKVYGLHQFADALARLVPGTTGPSLIQEALGTMQRDSMTWDVADPHGRGAAAARLCADEIDAALEQITRALIGVVPS
jgi:protein-tyrosine-phosphatase